MSMKSKKFLFSPEQVGALTLKHRVVMPALSRLRAHWPSATPTKLMEEYYGQRASLGGLIIAEATAVSPEARAYHTAPGLYSEEQVEAWKPITAAVHAKGGIIMVQLSHAGRATSSVIGGITPVSASVDPKFWSNQAIVVSTAEGFSLPSPHRALDAEEIPEIVDQFRTAAENADRAGFDGIEIQAGQGHLVEQFLQDGSNKRTDLYGGSIENRERFLIKIIEATTKVWGPGRVGVRISPSSTFNGMSDSNPRELFRHLAGKLNEYGLAYLGVIEPRISGADTISELEEPIASIELGKLFHGSIIAAGGFTPETAEKAVRDGTATLVAFGRHFTSNPDLPFRIMHDLPLAQYDRNTFYAFDARGYTDFSAYEQAMAAA